MNEKIKKYLTVLAYQAVFASGLFLLLLVLNRFAPGFVEKIGIVWRKSTDLEKVGRLLSEIGKELIPF